MPRACLCGCLSKPVTPSTILTLYREIEQVCGGLRGWECAPEELKVPFCQLYASCGVTLVPEFVAFTLRVCFLASNLASQLGVVVAYIGTTRK